VRHLLGKKEEKMVGIVRKSAVRIALMLGLLMAACASSGTQSTTMKTVGLKVVVLPFLNYAPFYIALEEGYFQEQALEVEFVRLPRNADATSALVQGELDVLGGTVNVGLLNALARGADIKIVADRGYLAPSGCANSGFVARRVLVEAGELDSPASLKGKQIAFDPVSFSGYLLDKLLDGAGLGLDDVVSVDVPNAAIPEALENGTIDLASVIEPSLTRTLQTEHVVLWMATRDIVPGYHNSFVIFGPNLLSESPDVGRRFMVAYRKAVQQYNQGKTERNVQIVAQHTELEPEFLMEVCWPHLSKDGRIDTQGLLDFQAWAVEKGYLDNPITEEQFWDASFVEYANEVLGASSQ
jgi:NitT/TauT family transport system substrate-binding protein